jgi:cell wall-associated NlpC family hydrolase
MSTFDRRTTPARPDLAAARLRGVIEAARYVEGTPRRVVAAVADLRPEPRPDRSIDTQAIRGEDVLVYDLDGEGWAWVELVRDGYVGWMPAEALGAPDPAPTHEVTALRTLVFPGPDLRFPVAGQLVQGARVAVVGNATTRGLDYALLSDGSAVTAKHLAPLGSAPAADWVEVAAAYVGTPYLWGGRTSLGIDCSGLVQAALARAGIAAPRDSDMQEAGVGHPVAVDGDLSGLRRGDLLFWPGHVAIVSGPNRLLHANGFHMATVDEPLDAAVARIAASGHPLRTVRRL